MKGTRWSRLAAASGIDYVIAIAVIAGLGEIKHFQNAGEYALKGSTEVWATSALLLGFSAVALFWFASTLAARLRQLEGGSGRLAAAVNGSGAILAGFLTLEVGLQFATRQTMSGDLAALATSVVNGPMLFFPAAVFVGATGVVGVRAEGLPSYSQLLARLSIPLAATFLAFAGLQLFENYAWINDTGYIVFGVWVLLLSIIGVVRWGDMDEPGGRPAPAPSPVSEPAALPGPAREVTATVAKRKPVRKATPRKTTARKPAPRKPAPRKP